MHVGRASIKCCPLPADDMGVMCHAVPPRGCCLSQGVQKNEALTRHYLQRSGYWCPKDILEDGASIRFYKLLAGSCCSLQGVSTGGASVDVPVFCKTCLKVGHRLLVIHCQQGSAVRRKARLQGVVTFCKTYLRAG